MPRSLRVKVPTRRAKQKLDKPPIPKTRNMGNFLPKMAEIYIPTPKNAAEASEI
jgi:hypothetical protein